VSQGWASTGCCCAAQRSGRGWRKGQRGFDRAYIDA
jgi:hypothetical protein